MKRKIVSLLIISLLCFSVFGLPASSGGWAYTSAGSGGNIIEREFRAGGINFPRREVSQGQGLPLPPAPPTDSGAVLRASYPNNIFVSPTGSNLNEGTQASPLRTVEFALRAVGEGNRINRNLDVNIFLENGIHTVERTLNIGNSHRLNGNNMLRIQNAPDAVDPVLSGGRQVFGWRETTVNGNTVWRAEMPEVETATALHIRNLQTGHWSSRQQAFDDGNHNRTYTAPLTHADGMAAYKAAGYSFSWFSPHGNPSNFDPREAIGFTFHGADLRRVENPAQIETRINVEWKCFLLRGEFVSGKNNLVMNQDAMYILTRFFYMNHVSNPWNMMYNIEAGRSERFVFFNDVSFIKHPGDFVFSENENALYYYPLPGETMTNIQAFVPVLEDFITVTGDYHQNFPPGFTWNQYGRMSGERFRNLTFQGLTFAHTANNFAFHNGGWTPNQAVTYIGGFDSYFDNDLGRLVYYFLYRQFRPNILVENADNVNFYDNTFFGMQRDALSYREAVRNCNIERNIFRDIGGSAVIVSREGLEYIEHDVNSGMPTYHPGWEYDPGLMVENIIVRNNFLRNIANHHHGQPAISLYYTRNCDVSNNDIYGTSYMPINMGWGWLFYSASKVSGGNTISGNRLGNFNTRVRDSGGIYTLGQQQGARVFYNYIFDQHEAYGGIYHDEGSSGFTTVFNVVENFNPQVSSNTWVYMNSLTPFSNPTPLDPGVPFRGFPGTLENIPESQWPGQPGYEGQTVRFNTVNYNFFNNERVVDRAENLTSTNVQLPNGTLGLNGEVNRNLFVRPTLTGNTFRDVTTNWASVSSSRPAGWPEYVNPRWGSTDFRAERIYYRSAQEIVNTAGVEGSVRTAMTGRYGRLFSA
jgi:hypothetical protein